MSRKKTLISELDLSKIGGRIAYLRVTNGMTQAQLSEKTGLSKGNVSGLEKHKYEPSYKAIIKIIELFKVNSEWLLLGKGSHEQSSPKETPENMVVIEHQDLVKRFKNSEKAKEMNEGLLMLEDIDEQGFDEIHQIINMKLRMKEADQKKRGSTSGRNTKRRANE